MMTLLKDVFARCGYDERQQDLMVDLIHKTAVSHIPEFKSRMEALDWLISITQEHWLRGQNLERWDIQDTSELSKERDEIMGILHGLDLIDDIHPKHKHYDYVLVMGALESRVKSRLAYAHKLHTNSAYDFDRLVMLGGARPLMAHTEQSICQLPAEKQTEHGMMMHVLESKQRENPNDEFFSKPIQDINTPMQSDASGKTRRPNTKDTVDDWLATNPKPGRVLVISNQPYCRYQHSTTTSLLPACFDVEAIGHRANEQDPIKAYLDSLARDFYTLKLALKKHYEQELTDKVTAKNKAIITSPFLLWCCSYSGIATLGVLATSMVVSYYGTPNNTLTQLGKNAFNFFKSTGDDAFHPSSSELGNSVTANNAP